MGKKKSSKKDTNSKKNRPQNGVQKTNATSGDRGTSNSKNEVKDKPSTEKGKDSSTDPKKSGEGFNVVKFFQESKEELAKVVWPSRQQLISESAAVVLMVTLVATTIYFVDNLFVWLSGRVF